MSKIFLKVKGDELVIRRRICIYIVLIVLFNIIYSDTKCIAASKDSYVTVTYGNKSYTKKYISVKVISANSNKIKIKLKNRGSKTYLYSEVFKIRKYKKGKWRKINYRKDAKFAKCLYKLEPNDSKIIKIAWKKYFDTEDFKRGKYKIIWMSNCSFRIKK